MEISQALIFLRGRRAATPNVPVAAPAPTVLLTAAAPHISNATASTLSEAIGDAPIGGDLPAALNAVVETGHAERLVVGLVPVLRDLFPRRLNLADLVGAA
jgi:hypothetical protein